jgi:CDP-diacylglycerol--glycerol-3-phosphate 3-phosphatidyltransferase
MAVLGGAMLISYERAKAESLGYDARGGLMERAERFAFLGFGLLFDSLLVPVLWVMLALILFTAAQRFAKVWAQASAERLVVTRSRARTRRTPRRRAARRSSETWTTRMRARRER